MLIYIHLVFKRIQLFYLHTVHDSHNSLGKPSSASQTENVASNTVSTFHIQIDAYL